MKILIADDESIIRLGLKSMLQQIGHEVLTAVNGREALQMARRHRPDLAILDIKMPYTDGLEAARTLARTQPLPILLLTAYGEANLINQASDLPIQGYLIKPIEPAELTAALAVAEKRFNENQKLVERLAKLETTLADRKLIDRAKGVLMDNGLDESESYYALQQYARQNQITLADAARRLLKQPK